VVSWNISLPEMRDVLVVKEKHSYVNIPLVKRVDLAGSEIIELYQPTY